MSSSCSNPQSEDAREKAHGVIISWIAICRRSDAVVFEHMFAVSRIVTNTYLAIETPRRETEFSRKVLDTSAAPRCQGSVSTWW